MTREFEPGDKIRVIRDPVNNDCHNLPMGAVYTVIEVNNRDKTVDIEKCSKPTCEGKCGWYSSRFEIVEEIFTEEETNRAVSLPSIDDLRNFIFGNT